MIIDESCMVWIWQKLDGLFVRTIDCALNWSLIVWSMIVYLFHSERFTSYWNNALTWRFKIQSSQICFVFDWGYLDIFHELLISACTDCQHTKSQLLLCRTLKLMWLRQTIRIETMETKCFFQFIINILVNCFWFIWIPILWVCDH